MTNKRKEKTVYVFLSKFRTRMKPDTMSAQFIRQPYYGNLIFLKVLTELKAGFLSEQTTFFKFESKRVKLPTLLFFFSV